MQYKVRYNSEGLPICEICGKGFARIGSHVRHSHSMTALEYRIKCGLDIKQSLCSKESAAKSRKAVMRNYDKCIYENLIVNNNHKFTKGRHYKKYLSEQSKRRITRQIAHTWHRPQWFDVELSRNINFLKNIARKCKIYSDDYIHDALEECMRIWYRWNRSGKLITWMFGVYRNVYIRQCKMEILFKKREDEYCRERGNVVYIDAEPDVIKVDLQHLTAHERRFAELLSEGKKVREIAEVLGNTPGSVKSYKYQLITKLREHFFTTHDRKRELKLAKRAFRNNTVDVLTETDRKSLIYQLN